MSIRVCISLVLYRHSLDDIRPLLSSIATFSCYPSHYRAELCVYDGSSYAIAGPTLSLLMTYLPGVEVFFKRGRNIGFGRANNFNYQQASLSDADFFIVANPDISFAAADLIRLLNWLASQSSVACVAPLVVDVEGAIQHSAKCNPTILSLFLGRFHCLTKIGFLRFYDLRHKNLDKDYQRECIQSPYLSGCFLIIPSRYYSLVGGFCPRFFLHLEDADLVRRLSSVGETLHNPLGSVIHLWARGSHKSLPQTLHLIQSCIAYFRIWGFSLY